MDGPGIGRAKFSEQLDVPYGRVPIVPFIRRSFVQAPCIPTRTLSRALRPSITPSLNQTYLKAKNHTLMNLPLSSPFGALA